MRTSIRKELRRHQKVFNQQINTLLRELKRQKDWQTMYAQLIERLQNVPKYCALKDPERIAVNYPLERFATFEMNTGIPSENLVLQHSHAENMYYAEAIIHDYATEALIHFEINTTEGRFHYQYSKKGIAVQPIKMILKEVAWMLAHAWFDRLHPKKGK